MRGKGRGAKNNSLNVNMANVSAETVVICVLLVVLLILVVYYVRQNSEGFQSEPHCVVYAFVADWCPHCKNAKPAIENLKNNAPANVNVEVVNEKDNNSRELMKKYNVRGFPTILLVGEDGTVIEFEQRVSEENLNNFVQNNANNAALNNAANNSVNANRVNNGNVNRNANRVNNGNANGNRVNNGNVNGNANRVNNGNGNVGNGL